MSTSSTSDSETLDGTDLLQELVSVLDDLLVPMHFLDDLEAVWDKLPEDEREEITASRVYREDDHKRRIESGLEELGELSVRLLGFKYRGIRKSIRQYIEHWKTFEPDQVKILQAQIKKQLG